PPRAKIDGVDPFLVGNKQGIMPNHEQQERMGRQRRPRILAGEGTLINDSGGDALLVAQGDFEPYRMEAKTVREEEGHRFPLTFALQNLTQISRHRYRALGGAPQAPTTTVEVEKTQFRTAAMDQRISQASRRRQAKKHH